MNSINNHIFRDYIARIRSDADVRRASIARQTKLSNRRILAAYLYIKGKIDERVNAENGFDPGFLADLEDFIKEKLSVIQIVVSDEADAYTLFETLNERGIDLSVLDLLKNHMLKRAGGNRPEVQRNWQEMSANLDDGAGSKFIRHFWVSRHGRVQASRVYRAIRDSLRTREQATELSHDLVKAAELYSALSNSEHEIWNADHQSVRDDIARLRLLNSSQCYPVLLAAREVMEAPAFARVLQLMVIMAVRYSLICSHRTVLLEIRYADIANKITRRELTRPGQIRRGLTDIFPSDDEFRDAFVIKELHVARQARFILRELEIQRRGGVIAPVEDPGSVNLEHIAPRQMNQHWNILAQGRESYAELVHRIGNLALIEKTANLGNGGSSFREKKEAFERSEISLTQNIAGYDQWTNQEISARQSELATLAIARWAFPAD